MVSAFVALMWTAILTVQAGNFLQRCLEAIWPSFINFPNHIPLSAGVTCKFALTVRYDSRLHQSSRGASLYLPLLVRSDGTRSHAHLKAQDPLLGEGCHRSSNFLRL